MKSIGVALGAGTLLALGGAISACSTTAGGDMNEGAAMPAATGDVAYAQVRGADGTVHARAVLTEYDNGVRVVADLMDVPAGTHALHVHETGDCSASDFTSAGGHWNPTNQPHPNHKGDLPNFTPDASGKAQVTAMIEGVSLNGATMPALDADGAAMIIHANADDMMSQPSGDAGARIACGVITMGS